MIKLLTPLLLVLSLVSALDPIIDNSKDITIENSATYFSEIFSPVQGIVINILKQPSESFKMGDPVVRILKKSVNTANTANNIYYNKGDAQADVAIGANIANDDSIDLTNWRQSPTYDAKALHDGMVVKLLKNIGDEVIAGTKLAQVWYAVSAPGHNAGEEEW